ncbi:MAG: AsmA family protein, partial [Gammaproteobacteria bacterium]|nr:AsmA family protein [Gammaproteobacteria bacterium]
MHLSIKKQQMRLDLMILLSLILRKLLFFIVLLGLLTGILDYANVSFKSDKARQVLLENIKTYTGRDVSIDGDAYLTVSLSPKLLVKQIHIRNIDGFDSEDFITITEARVEVSLLPLLSGTFHLEEISADQAKINLIQKKDSSHNWSFDHVTWAIDTKSEEPKDGLKKQRRITRSSLGLSLGVFSLTDISILYKDESRDQIIEKHFERLMVNVKDINKPYAEIFGSLQGSPYNLSFESDPLHSLASGQPWSLHGTGNIAGSRTNIEASIRTIENSIDGNFDIKVKSINLGLIFEKLGFIAGQDAAANEANIKARLHGSNLTELYQQAEIELQLLRGYWNLQSIETDQKKELSFTEVTSFASWHKPVELHLNGM